MSGRDLARQRANGGSTAVEQHDGNTVRGLFESMGGEIQRALPRHMSPDRMIRVALTVVNQSDKLKQCDPRSLLGALMTCTQVGLEPGPQGHVYLVPYGRNVTFIMGYQGMIELARRSGLLVSIAAHTIYANEVEQGRFRVTYGTDNTLRHDPIIFEDRGQPVGYYAAAKIKSPSSDAVEDVFVVLTRDEVDAFRARSATQNKDRASGPWQSDYEAMAWKTCIRRLAKWLPQSPELAAALEHEDTVRTDLGGNVVDQAQPAPAEPFEAPQALAAPISDPSSAPAHESDQQQGPPPGSDTMDPSDPDDPWSTPRP